MSEIRLPIVIPSVPVGFCFTTWQESLPQLFNGAYAEGEVSPNLHIGDDPPTDLTKWWARTVSGIPDRIYGYASGVWLSRHPDADRIGKTELAPAGLSADDVATYDGGEAGVVTAFTGPMWEIDTDFAAMFPIGPGTLESGMVLSEGNTGGTEKVPLTIAEIPPHHHIVLASQANVGGGSDANRLKPNAVEADSNANTANAGGTDGVVEPHQNMPPYRVRYFLKKSARTHYRAS